MTTQRGGRPRKAGNNKGKVKPSSLEVLKKETRKIQKQNTVKQNDLKNTKDLVYFYSDLEQRKQEAISKIKHFRKANRDLAAFVSKFMRGIDILEHLDGKTSSDTEFKVVSYTRILREAIQMAEEQVEDEESKHKRVPIFETPKYKTRPGDPEPDFTKLYGESSLNDSSNCLLSKSATDLSASLLEEETKDAELRERRTTIDSPRDTTRKGKQPRRRAANSRKPIAQRETTDSTTGGGRRKKSKEESHGRG